MIHLSWDMRTGIRTPKSSRSSSATNTSCDLGQPHPSWAWGLSSGQGRDCSRYSPSAAVVPSILWNGHLREPVPPSHQDAHLPCKPNLEFSWSTFSWIRITYYRVWCSFSAFPVPLGQESRTVRQILCLFLGVCTSCLTHPSLLLLQFSQANPGFKFGSGSELLTLPYPLQKGPESTKSWILVSGSPWCLHVRITL